MFSQSVIEKLLNYVYLLKDPRDGKIFYVGKGVGNRVFAHSLGELFDDADSEKLRTISEIRQAGATPIYLVVRHGLTSEVAIEIESTLIDVLLHIGDLTNIVLGHDSSQHGLMTTDEIESLYAAEEVEITDPVIIITVNRFFERNIEPEILYQITRSAWRVDPSKHKPKYALSTYRGLVREVYQIAEWHPHASRPNRFEFSGSVAQEDVRIRYKNKALTKYVSVGAQNPIRYINC